MYKEQKCNHHITITNKQFGTVKCVNCGYAWDNDKAIKKKRKQYINKRPYFYWRNYMKYAII